MEIKDLTVCLTIIICFVGTVGVALPIQYSATGKGTHKGYITAIEQEGYIYKNYRVYVKTELSSSQEDVYCMRQDRNDLADKLKGAQDSKQPVSVVFEGVKGIGYDECNDIQIVDIK